MKKLKTFLTLSLCLIAMFMFVGCCGEEEQPTLSTPTNTTISNDKVVKFDIVTNATYYVINVNGINYYAYLNETPQISTVDSKVNYDAKSIMHQNTTYVVKVKAGANGYKESEFGMSASFVNSVKLNKTSVEVIGKTATWEPVENADYYNLKIVLPTDEENDGSQANLVTYQVQGKNYFDFSSILSDAGEYNFYVSAGSFNQYFLESDYSDATTKSTYKNYITLSTPQNIKIHKDNGNYYLLAVVDENTTDLRLVVDETETVVPLTSEHVVVDEKLTNYVKINLSTLFASADFTKNKDYSFAVQSMGGNYFEKSATAETNLHLNYATLQATQASYDATTRVLTWVASTDENAIGYNIYVTTASGVEKNYCSKESTQYMLPENFISAYVQVVGKDATIKNSLFSNAISSNTTSLGEIQVYKAYRSEEGTIQPVTSGEFNCLSWSPIAGAKYLVEFANAVIDIGDSFYVPIDSWKEDYGAFILHAYKNGYKEITRAFVLTDRLTLTSPKNLHVEIESPTVLKFDASVGALGYKLYVTDKAEAEAKWEEICEEYVQDSSRQLAFNEYLQEYAITKLFATNEIDAKPYINTIGAYKMFVQAVADSYTVYNNSKIKYEDGINVSLFYTLETPTFFKNAQGEVAPVEEVTMSSGKHYILKFYGTEGANVYEVFIKYGIGTEEKLTVQHDDRTGYYSVDITNNLVDGGEYTIKVRARYTGDDALILPSGYAQHTYVRIVQLNKVTNINVSVSGARILTFDEQEHAYGGYKVEITKVGESYPVAPFVVASSGTNIGGYISGKGNFCVTITALGKPEGYTQETYYTDSEAVSYYFTV